MADKVLKKQTIDVPIITICIPTYNRGDRLLSEIRGYLGELDERWPILILNNDSNKTCEYYEEISNLCEAHDHINYYKQDTNVLLHGNLISMFNIVKSQFALVVSDEDVPNFLFLRTFYDFLSKNPQIGSIRTSVQPTRGQKAVNSTIFADKVFEPGALGISEFSVCGNYISGQIWNVKLMNEKEIVQKLEQNANAQSTYPHLYLNILVAAQAQTMTTSAVGVFEGPNYGDNSLGEVSGYFGAYSYGGRIDQFIALRDALLEVFSVSTPSKFIAKDFYNAYIRLYAKFLMLICCANARQYVKHGLDVKTIANAFSLFALGAITRVPEYESYEGQLVQNVENVKDSLLSKYGPMVGY